MIFAAYDAPREGPVGTRTEFRVDDLVETLGAEIKAAAGAE